jgi:serine/threonine protein kinase
MDPSAPPPSSGRASSTRDLTPSHDSTILLADRYRLERRIGQGGMAEVWVATDVQLDRRVAVKWLRPALASDPVLAERFRREAIAVARLNHPNIVAVHDVVEHAGRQAVVMQFVDGKSLRQLLDTQKRLGPELTIHIGAAVASALDEAHRGGFVHRDVKPGNILVTSDGRVLLADFGIAKGLDAAGEDLTSDNVMMGTAKYLSPEQVRGRKLDGRADLYSLGLVLYECLAGRVPFLGETDADTALARLQRDPTDLNRLRPTLPTGLVDLIHRTLARNPAHRPATGAELRAALLAVDTAPPLIDRTPSQPTSRPAPLDPDLLRPKVARPAKPAQTGTSGPRIPGEPPVQRPVQRPPQPADPDMTPIPGAYRTPPAGVALRGIPARGLQQNQRASLFVILALLAVAAIVAAVVWVSLLSDSGDGLQPMVTSPIEENTVPPETSPESPSDSVGAGSGEASNDAPPAATTPAATTTPAPAPTTPAPTTPAPVTTIAWGPATITSITAWDPEGDGSGENDQLAALALAGAQPEGGWATLCYSSQYLGAKDGVGLIVNLSGPTAGTFSYSVLHAPYWVEVFTRTNAERPATLADWGDSLTGTQYNTSAADLSVVLPPGTQSVLVWVREIGRDRVCSRANPYRGRIGNISFINS